MEEINFSVLIFIDKAIKQILGMGLLHFLCMRTEKKRIWAKGLAMFV